MTRLLATRRPDSRQLTGLLGIVGVLVVWQLLAVTVLREGGAVPTPVAVVQGWVDDRWTFYSPQVTTTLSEALRGFLWGNVAAIVLAAVVVLLPFNERVVLPLGIASYCLPVLALAPILAAVFEGTTSMAALAALSRFFTTLLGTLLGLRSAPAQATDLVKAYGGSSWTVLRAVSLPSAWPALFTAARISVPGCIIGALLDERLATGTGLGYQVLKDASTFAHTHLRSSVVVLTVVSVVLYYLVGAAESVVTTRFRVVTRR